MGSSTIELSIAAVAFAKGFTLQHQISRIWQRCGCWLWSILLSRMRL